MLSKKLPKINKIKPINAKSRKSEPISKPDRLRFGKMKIAKYATRATLSIRIETVIPRNEIAGLMLLIDFWS
jgi:hypothetical protein